MLLDRRDRRDRRVSDEPFSRPRCDVSVDHHFSGLQLRPESWALDRRRHGGDREGRSLFASSGVRTPGSCLLSLICPSSITDVSAVIYELRGAGGTWLEGTTWPSHGGLLPLNGSMCAVSACCAISCRSYKEPGCPGYAVLSPGPRSCMH
ncbi:hypothetical protein KUCAC02_018693 [Chaenocephalus aceratus]|uniref:Uncharacterized protein n=1 Tax=Chaenocephalus aceratus TaxID=36190 RepID=A0ACB9W9A3_CHAAC|nr:hypothetical protein KUCAC02_018693 [Chaenocephalus aceratus]